MAYWWSPDSSFVLYEPALVELPPYSKSEYKQNLFQSQNETHLQIGILQDGPAWSKCIARRKSRADTGIHRSYYGYLVKSSQVKDEHAAPLNVCPPFAPPYNRENHQVEILG